jgi:hypothetical protein
MIILWITKRKKDTPRKPAAGKLKETAMPKSQDAPEEITPDVKDMITGDGDTLAPVHMVRLNKHACN